MTKKELMAILSDKKIKDNIEVEVLCNRSYPNKIETVYYDKKDERVIIETN